MGFLPVILMDVYRCISLIVAVSWSYFLDFSEKRYKDIITLLPGVSIDRTFVYYTLIKKIKKLLCVIPYIRISTDLAFDWKTILLCDNLFLTQHCFFMQWNFSDDFFVFPITIIPGNTLRKSMSSWTRCLWEISRCLHEAKECVAKKVAIILQRDFKRLFFILELIYTDILHIYTDIFRSDIQAKIQPQAL
jgi:hypothetical protein